ncbi:MAG: 5-histidylcysteine sulfoxide synthase [Colwellia sp.]|nr:5-histidylcysteine sulfoxide synthase [Colwellia sp.]MCW8865958.1 5-histidylcysteine sulfoxide synthase [Colwellia sp.]MCW9082351.1 5-histidylcysteine sulfoxide synthase [Colwellia sp.]
MDVSNKSFSKPPRLNGHSVESKKQELKDYFLQTWAEYESLFGLINDDKAYYLRPEPLRHPLIFYFGHTATFYINKLMLGKFIDQRLNSKLEAICAVGVDEMSWDDLNSDHYDWPSVDEVRAYRKQVSALIVQLIDTMALSLPIQQNSLAWVILMGCEHERIHIETSSVIMRMLPLTYLTANKRWPTCTEAGTAPQNQLVNVSGQSIVFGKPDSDDTFGWDNEYGHDEITLENFTTSKYLVSNQEYLAFVEAKGYQQPQFWTEEGQAWLAFTKANMPRFWCQKTDANGSKVYYQRNLLNEIPLPMNWPVEVNYLEAKAFCHWKSQAEGEESYRLPTESEWLCLRNQVTGDLVDWQHIPGNINLALYASSCPVDKFSQGHGLFDIVGNVWQWTESNIDGFQGFEVHPLYDDFSTPTFDGKHNLIKGGSWISTGNEAMKHSRYAFRRHFFQHAGFRYVKSHGQQLPNLASNHYETNVDICRQLHAHYGAARSAMPLSAKNYSQQIADHVLACVDKYHTATHKCLDLGCSVGRASFILAQYFNHLDGVDFSAGYIRHGVKLQQGKSIRYTLENEGDIVDFHEVKLSDVDLPTGENIHFSQGDASNLKSIFTGYDLVLAQHVLEQSYYPRLFLKSIHQRLNANGLLIVVSDYHFDEQQADKNTWLGGVKINGENVTGFEGLSAILSNHFTLLEQHQLTRTLKVNRRNFQLSFPHMTVWQLK